MSQKMWVFYFKLNLYQFAWDLLQNSLISREYIISKMSTDHLQNELAERKTVRKVGMMIPPCQHTHSRKNSRRAYQNRINTI